MTKANNLIFSDNLCCAFIAAIVRSYEKKVGGDHYLGRTAMQKLVYFARALSVPIPCSFEIYTYGPYSDAVTFSVESMMADDILRDTSHRPKYSNYRLGDNADEILNKYAKEIKPYDEQIDTLVKVLGKFRPEHLELIATLHFAHESLKKITRQNPKKEAVVREFIRFKGDKFIKNDVSSWYDALKNAHVIE
jgi:uncharacterized protein